MVEHNNANMIALGADFMTKEEGLERVLIFLNSSFAGGKHQIRVNLISDYENNH
jgi:ribose 5-phosphate isomerase B